MERIECLWLATMTTDMLTMETQSLFIRQILPTFTSQVELHDNYVDMYGIPLTCYPPGFTAVFSI